MYVHPDSQPQPVFAGRQGGCLIALLCVSVLGVGLEYVAHRLVRAHPGGGDGLHEAPLFLAWMAFGPLQLVAVIWLMVRLRRASLPRIDG